jgi:hypothetical protein
MSNSDNTLTVTAADDMAEIAVMDGSLNVIANGIGKFQRSLPQGIYKIRVRVGPTVDQKLVSLDKNVQLDFPAFKIPSPIPLDASTVGNPVHAGAAIEASRTVKDSFGTGASVLVFAREQSGERNPQTSNPAAGLSFVNENGQQLADIAQRAEVRLGPHACAGWRADLDPGPFRLRLVERAVYASRDNQVQIFLLQCDFTVSDSDYATTRMADMSGSAISIATHQEFSPQNERTRLSEIARYALTQRRRILSDAFLDNLLDEKFDDPMLGLLGAHLLLRDKPNEAGLFKIVTDNLVRLLGSDHPDVRALLLAREDSGNFGSRLGSPPMLRASWDLGVEHSIRYPSILSMASPENAIADKIMSDAPWLIWRIPSGDGLSTAERTIKEYLGARIRAETSRAQAMPRSMLGRLSATFNDLVGRKPTVLPATPLDAEEKADLSRTLGVPDQVLKSMLEKLSR